MKIIKWAHFLTIFQVFLGIVYLSAGLGKLIPGFPSIIGPVWLIDELEKYGLGLFGYFIAIMQAFIGGLLLVTRFRLIASLMLLPMHMCILIIPISLGWQGTPYINAIFLCMLLALLFNERKKIIGLLDSKPITLSIKSNKVYLTTFIVTWGIALLLRYGLG